MKLSTALLWAIGIATIVGCREKVAMARGDSLQSVVDEQLALTTRLASQKDSLTRVVLDADAFLGQMDSAISSVKGLPRGKGNAGDPLADQLQARKDMLTRVNALVARTRQTAAQLADARKQSAASASDNARLQTQIDDDVQLIADLGATIERQARQIDRLEARLDSLGAEVTALGARHYRAYYVIGTEEELTARGIVVKRGGANLLFFRPGQTVVPARVLDPAAFTVIDQREVLEIQLPDTTARYRLVSQQNLDAAEVGRREGASFSGTLRITRPDEFWAASRFLILVKS